MSQLLSLATIKSLTVRKAFTALDSVLFNQAFFIFVNRMWGPYYMVKLRINIEFRVTLILIIVV